MWIGQQIDVKDCGIYLIQAFLKYFYKYKCDINFLKENAVYDELGISLFSLQNLGKNFGLNIEVLEGNFNNLMENKLSKPVATILKINNFYHYVIIEKIYKDFVVINDSVNGKHIVLLSDFKNLYQGFIILFDKVGGYVACFPKQNYKINLKIKKYWLFLSLLLSIVSQCFAFALSFYGKYIFDSLWSIDKSNKIITYFVVFSWILILKCIANLFNFLINKKILFNLDKSLNKMFFNKLKTIKQKDIDKISKTNYYQTFLLIPIVVEHKITIFNLLGAGIVSLASSIILLAIIMWQFLLITVLANLLIFIFSLLFNFKSKKLVIKILEEQNLYIENMFEIFKTDNLRYHRNYNEVRLNKFENNLEKLFNLKNKFVLLDENKNLINSFIFNFASMLTIFTGAMFFIYSSMDLGNILLFSAVNIFLTNPIQKLVNLISKRNYFLTSLIRIKYFLNLTNKKLTSICFEDDDIKSIVFKNFCFKYGTKNVINNLNLYISQNSIFEGKNGCGKSSLLNVLSKIYDKYEGSLLINNIDLKTINYENWIEHVFISNSRNFLANDIVLNNICLGIKSYEQTFLNNYQKYKLEDIFKEFNLSLITKIENNGENLSSGQKQLIFIMRLFIKKYKLILLDEAFENIKNVVFIKLKQFILAYQNNAFILEVSHNKKFITKANKNSLCFL
ncbi:ATP-binding cassette domain-containing protein [[Mycoplasma] falconis]|uniref:ATP-binding cassette domain-containing protein n=1 Tax=[Mycoplasma] falconis TaxID=92403 RepID=A0A501XB82_9BACT|nr:cysteine peptidase family C39 domain-containing protein [[Mycoplasma] falconis]TPE57782.1 ATP-binding cassette domain-containing protein [[Mycoplasma] falconis]